MDVQNIGRVQAFTTKDGSEIRELLAHRNSCIQKQSLAEARLPPGAHRREQERHCGRFLPPPGMSSRPQGVIARRLALAPIARRSPTDDHRPTRGPMKITMRYFALSDGQAHYALCSCLSGRTMDASTCAQRLRNATGNVAWESAVGAWVLAALAVSLPGIVYLLG